jgi:hypothetical protein
VVGALGHRLSGHMADGPDGRHEQELDGSWRVNAEIQQMPDAAYGRLKRGEIPVEVDWPLVVCGAVSRENRVEEWTQTHG